MAKREAGYDPYGTLQVSVEGTRYDGAEVVMRLDMPFEESIRILDRFDEIEDPNENGAPRRPWREQVPEKQALFQAELLVSWNLFSGDTSLEAVKRAPWPLVQLCIGQWSRALWDPSVPLSGTRSDTSSSAQ